MVVYMSSPLPPKTHSQSKVTEPNSNNLSASGNRNTVSSPPDSPYQIQFTTSSSSLIASMPGFKLN